MSEEVTKSQGNNKFLKGTLILTISSIVVKVIGALNWVILSRIMGGEGIGLYQMGFPIYLMAITVSSAGIPVAISIITAEKVAMEDYGGAQRLSCFPEDAVLHGAPFSLLLVVLAHWLVETVLPDARAYYSIIALAPAVFFVTFLASFRGYFQGWQIMTPTACSEITEQVVRVGTMIVFSALLLPYGLTYAAAGASIGAGAGAFCGLLVLMGFYLKLKKKFSPKGVDRTPKTQESAGYIMKRLIALALPVSMSSLMLPIVSNLDMMIVPTRLKIGGWDAPGEATTLLATFLAWPCRLSTCQQSLRLLFPSALCRLSVSPGPFLMKRAFAARWQRLLRWPRSSPFPAASAFTFWADGWLPSSITHRQQDRPLKS